MPLVQSTLLGPFSTTLAFRASSSLQGSASRGLSALSGSSRLSSAYPAFSTGTSMSVPHASTDHLLLVSDLDLTMVDHKDLTHTALLNFNLLWAAEFAHTSHVVYSTGRSMQRYSELQREAPLWTPHALILSVGTEVRRGPSLEIDEEWAKELDDGWNRDVIVEEAMRIPSLRFQEEPDQGSHKVSLKVDKAKGEEMQKMLSTKLSERGLRVKVLYSSGIDLDVLPYKAGKGAALAYLLKKLNFAPKNILVCGDSGNDIDLFTVHGVHGVIVSNAQEELLEWYNTHGSSFNVYHAHKRCASGIVEALQHFGLGPHLSPNEVISKNCASNFSSSEGSSSPHPGAVHREVVEFKQFIMKWLLGQVPNKDNAFGRLSGVISNGAKIISPDGIESNTEALLEGLKKKYGSMRGRELAIWFNNIQVQILSETVYLATWQHWEKSEGRERRGYVASAILSAKACPFGFQASAHGALERKRSGSDSKNENAQIKAGAPNGVEWVHLHETLRSA